MCPHELIRIYGHKRKLDWVELQRFTCLVYGGKHLFGKLFEFVLVYSHFISSTSNISAKIINELLISSYNFEAFASELSEDILILVLR